MRLLQAAAVGATFLVAACSTTPVQCGACPPVVYATVGLQAPGRAGTAIQDVMRAGVLRVCLSGWGCWRAQAGRDKQMVMFPAGIDRERASGRRLTATLAPADGSRVWRGRGVLTDTDGGDEPCSCSYTSAHLVLSR